MKLEIMNKNKLKIAFSSEELEENGISVHTFLSSNTIMKKFIYAILEIAEEELNFTYKNYKLNIESFSFNNTHFIIYITTKNELIYTFSNQSICKKLISFTFSSQSEAISFLKRNYNYLINKKISFNLYKYSDYYFLFIDIQNIDLKQIKKMQISFLDEISSYYTSTIIYSKIREYGKLILNKETINDILLIS